ncbi:MAG: hypothetical protein JWN63_1544 [Candidatus Acidoferrum typicum]|nr:hypothetical protein [Candidatus Acidoferrum typicum]
MLDPLSKWLDSDVCIRMKTNALRGSPVAQWQSIRLLTEGLLVRI